MSVTIAHDKNITARRATHTATGNAYMIIDLILNRKDGVNIRVIDGKIYTTGEYNPKDFYHEVTAYGDVGFEIAEMLDNGTENNVKQSLINYILDNDYNPDIINYINSVDWL